MIADLALVLKALGDERRLRIAVLLTDCQLCVGHIQTALEMEQSHTSKQLTILRNAKIVKKRKDKQRAYYTLHPELEERFPQLVASFRKRKMDVICTKDRELVQTCTTQTE